MSAVFQSRGFRLGCLISVLWILAGCDIGRQLSKVETHPLNFGVGKLDVVGNYAYVAHGYEGLLIFDLSEPTQPVQVGSVKLPGFPEDVVVSGDYAYVSAQAEGLRIVDISDPTAPVEVGAYRHFGVEVAIQEPYAYFITGRGGMVILDISDPTEPAKVGSFRVPDLTHDVVVHNNYAYLSVSKPSGVSDFLILDISNPVEPRLISSLEVGARGDISVVNQFAYVVDMGPWLNIIDISNPSLPRVVGRYSFKGYASEVEVVGDYAYVGDVTGVWVLDVSNPQEPDKIAGRRAKGVEDIAVAHGYIYVTDNDLIIYEAPP